MAIKKLLILALILVALWPISSYADEPRISLEEIEKLIDSSPSRTLKAYFKTVPRGIKIKSYKITIEGIFREPDLEVILFKSRHQIASGMSGSPVYIKGKKIGAVAYSLNKFSNQHWGGISSISLMSKDAEAGHLRLSLVRSFTYKGMIFEPIALGSQTVKGLENFAGGKFMVISQTSSAISSRVKTKKPVLRAGMPIVVDLVEWTDEKGKTSTISAMGTITDINSKGRIFAFGHPFLDAKKVVYAFRTAEIINTIPSQENAYKLPGKRSEVLGAITVDSLYGIYGNIGSDELEKFRHFSLEFKKEGKFFHKFDIKVADSVLTPILAQVALEIIGNTYDAPLPQETGATQIESRVDIKDQKPFLWKGLFAFDSIKFGLQTFYISSYRVAFNAFFTEVYSFLFENSFGLKISDVSISVNFISGRSRVYKLGAYKFPDKVVYGRDPVLDILFVDENNIMPIAKKVTVAIDWSKVEKPVYTKNTLNTEKTPEKVVRGQLMIESAVFFLINLFNSEQQKLLPKYFLSPEDFLENFSNRLEINNQKIFVRLWLRSRSGLFDEIVIATKDIIPDGISADGSGWYVIKEGLKERKLMIKNEGVVVFYVNLPDIPDGYILDQKTHGIVNFEVVLEK